MTDFAFPKRDGISFKTWWVPLILSAGLIPVSQYSPLLFHTLVEFFSVTIAIISLVVAWNTYSLSKNHYLMCLGLGYFWVGILDLAHTFTFKGMPFINPLDVNSTISLWIVTRYFEAALLLSAPFLCNRSINRVAFFIVFGVISSFLMYLVAKGAFPEMFSPKTGLSDIKIINEWIIILILIGAACSNYYARQMLDKRTLELILISIGLTIAAELMFTMYTNLFGLTLIGGHFLKLFSYWAIYIALIESSLREPFRALSRGANTYDAVPDETVLVDRGGIVRQVNKAVRQTMGLTSSDCIGRSCHNLQHANNVHSSDCEICLAIKSNQSIESHTFFNPENEQWYEVTLSPVSYNNRNAGMVHVRRNITEAKITQDRFVTLNRLYTVLSHSNKAIIGADSREVMFQRICDIAITHGGFLMAWVGVIHGDRVLPQCSAGDVDGYLEVMRMMIDDSDLANGPVGRSAKSGEVNFVNDTATDPTFTPWREEAQKRGYQALVAIPLKFKGEVFGIFTIYSTLPDVFDSQMVELLTGLGIDLSRAMYMIDKEQRRLSIEKKLYQLSQAVEQSANAIIITDIDAKIEYVNRSFTQLTGYTLEDALGETPSMLRSEFTEEETVNEIKSALAEGREWHGKIQNRRKDGSVYWSQQSIFIVRDEFGEPIQFVSTSDDHTELHEAQEMIQQLAFYDPLTHLPNRRLLSDRFEQEIGRIDRNPNLILAVMVLDLDNFKTVNDSLGHNVGDSLLKHVARVLQSSVRQEDTVARLGGDEFAIIMSGAKVGRVVDVSDRIIRAFSEPLEIDGNKITYGASIGIAMYPQDAEDTDTLLRNADLAMYHAKSEGKNNFQFYREDLNVKAHDRLSLENKIRSAIENEHFQLFYQPQVDVRTGEMIGLEALIRWIDPEKGIIPPMEFIPLAEDTGMIGKIGDWVIQKACEEVGLMHKQGLPNVKVAVNVSAHQFRHGDHLCNTIENALKEYELPSEFLSLELTESILIEDIEDTIRSLNQLKGLNITLAIDDFGTGYSSLSYLKTFPIDVLKIDQTFIRDILTDESDKAIVTAIIAMSNQLGLGVLAEGVETQAHNDFLIDKGCNFAQGYFYCKPKPMNELLEFWLNKEKVPN